MAIVLFAHNHHTFSHFIVLQQDILYSLQFGKKTKVQEKFIKKIAECIKV